MKSWFSFLRRPASIKTVRILKLWEELSTFQIKASPIFAKHSTSSQTKLLLEEPLEKMVMPTNGFQLTQWRKSKRFKTPSIPKWRRLAFPKFCTSSTSSGETLWEKKTRPSRPNTLFKCKIFVDNSWPKRHSMKMSPKETSLALRKKSSSWTCKSTTTSEPKLSKVEIQDKIWISKIPAKAIQVKWRESWSLKITNWGAKLKRWKEFPEVKQLNKWACQAECLKECPTATEWAWRWTWPWAIKATCRQRLCEFPVFNF